MRPGPGMRPGRVGAQSIPGTLRTARTTWEQDRAAPAQRCSTAPSTPHRTARRAPATPKASRGHHSHIAGARGSSVSGGVPVAAVASRSAGGNARPAELGAGRAPLPLQLFQNVNGVAAPRRWQAGGCTQPQGGQHRLATERWPGSVNAAGRARVRTL